MSLATLSIDLSVKLAEFQRDMNEAAAVAQSTKNRIDASFATLGKGIAGLGIAAAVTAGINSLRGAIDKLDGLDDLAEKFGVTAENLSAYRYAAEVAGTPTEAFASGLQKLSKSLTSAAGGSKEQAKAFQTVGVSIRDAVGNVRSVDEVLLDLADKFAGYTSGATKAALATEFFGKQGEELIPLLNKGRSGISELRSEAEKLGAVYGNDLAKAAGDFNDNLNRLSLASEAAKVSLVSGLLPALVDFTNQLIEGRKAYGGFWSALKDIGLKTDPFKTTAQNLKDANEQAEKLQATITALGALEGTKGRSTPESRAEEIAEEQKKLDLVKQRQNYLRAILGMEQNSTTGLRAMDNGIGSGGTTAAPIVPSGSTKEKDKDIERAAKMYDDLIKKIRERNAETDIELETGAKLSASQQLAIGLVEDLARAEAGLTDEQRKSFDARRAAAGQEIGQAVLRGKALDQQREYMAAIAKESQELARRAQQLDEDNRASREYLDTIGLTTRELEDLQTARMADAIARKESNLAARDEFATNELLRGQMETEIDLMREQLKLRKDTVAAQRKQEDDVSAGYSAAVKGYFDEISKRANTAKEVTGNLLGGLEDGLTSMITKGKADWSSYVDYIIDQVIRLQVIQPLLQSLFAAGGSGAGLLGSAVGAIVGGGSTTAAAAAAAPMMANGMGAKSMVNITNNVQAGVTKPDVLQALQQSERATEARIIKRLKDARVL